MLGFPGLSVLLFLEWTFNHQFDFGGSSQQLSSHTEKSCVWGEHNHHPDPRARRPPFTDCFLCSPDLAAQCTSRSLSSDVFSHTWSFSKHDGIFCGLQGGLIVGPAAASTQSHGCLFLSPSPTQPCCWECVMSNGEGDSSRVAWGVKRKGRPCPRDTGWRCHGDAFDFQTWFLTHLGRLHSAALRSN